MGIRVIKTAIAAVIAIYAADWLSLSAPLSAGLLAVLAVDVTRRRTLRTAFQRFGSSILALLFASLIFYWFGFHYWVISIFILVTYPILARVRLKDGIITASVVVFHVFTQEEITFAVLRSELLLLFIGLGTGTLINMLYMPGAENKLKKLKEDTEELFSSIFQFISTSLRNPETIWSGNELLLAQAKIDEALSLVGRYEENQLLRFDPYWYIYFQMRKQQLESIHRMVEAVARIFEHLPHGNMVSELFDELSADVKSNYFMGRVSEKLGVLEERFKEMSLPNTRAEFEIRSAILQLILELKHYMAAAERGKKRDPDA